MTETPQPPVEQNGSADPADELPEQMRVRRDKRDRLLESGVEPYPVGVPRTTTLAAVRRDHPDLPPDTETGEEVGVTGRVIFLRNTGKLCFATLREGGPANGTELQVMLSLAIGRRGVAGRLEGRRRPR